ncbi:TPA: hypothetical protein ACX13H_003203 [Acinetobacter baumannii]
MKRGYFNNKIKDSIFFKENSKKWVLSIEYSTPIWYDLIMDECEEYKEFYKEILNDQVEASKDCNEKEFIYFFTSRPKVRFDLSRKIKIGKNIGEIFLNLIINCSEKRKVNIDHDYWRDFKKIIINEKFITFKFDEDVKITWTIHVFLYEYNVELGLESEVHYIGKTKDPVSRTMTREHRGYSDMLYYLLHLKEKRDIFLNVLIFKVSVISPPHNSIGIFSTNSVLDHIPKELEIFVIEYCLIYYFKSSIQKGDMDTSWSKFVNYFRDFQKEGINALYFKLEMKESTEYNNLGTPNLAAKKSHYFSWQLNENGLQMERFYESKDLDEEVFKDFFV